jgi:hypothetical protein
MIKASLILIAATLLLGIVLYIGHRREKIKIRNGETKADAPEQPEIPAECCGAHEICERDSLLAAVSKKIEYYDDEELDEWKGTPADRYDDRQTETFREILYSMRSDEVAGWVRSLQLRGIELPDGIKDEVLLIVGERRL